jgi:hypothetical protein
MESDHRPECTHPRGHLLNLNLATLRNVMDPSTAERLRLMKRILDIQGKICDWSTSNSQSSPGAMMELRQWRKDLLAAIRVYDNAITHRRNPGEESGGAGGGGTGTK